MILPIVAYGHPILKKVSGAVKKDESILELIQNMWETMYKAKGVGLAAPQVGVSKRLFLVDTIQLEKEDEIGIKKAFLNAEIIEENGPFWTYEEGCLSIPNLTGDVNRQESITIKYQNEDFEEFEETFTGMTARVIQHEFDHIEGILFTERLKPLKRRMLSRKLEQIKKGKVEVDYRMRFKQ